MYYDTQEFKSVDKNVQIYKKKYVDRATGKQKEPFPINRWTPHAQKAPLIDSENFGPLSPKYTKDNMPLRKELKNYDNCETNVSTLRYKKDNYLKV